MGDQVAYEYTLTISLYRVIQRVMVMTLNLGVVNGGCDMIDRSWGCVCDMTARIRYSGDPGEIYVHDFVYMCSDMFRLCCMTWGGYMDVVIDPGEVD